MLTAVYGVGVLVGYLNAEFLYFVNRTFPRESHGQRSHTSSIAITTSTVSKLSSPRSFEKCEALDSCDRMSLTDSG